MIQIIPAIDIINGKCVRLTQGDYGQTTIYSSVPTDMAKRFEDEGITRLHMVDLDGARLGRLVNLETLQAVASKTSLTIDFGGGIKQDADVQQVFDSGAAMINVGSIAYKEPARLMNWVEKYGWGKILLGADVKDNKIMINGWKEQTTVDIIEYINSFYTKGLRQLFCTDVAKDGMMEGPAVELYKIIINAYPDIQLTASGGVTNINDINELEAIGCSGVVIGKALYEGQIKIEELNKYRS
jgi:phosphoribosylformimino-5-aminoimidazole carboxamide ribotide isomerase